MVVHQVLRVSPRGDGVEIRTLKILRGKVRYLDANARRVDHPIDFKCGNHLKPFRVTGFVYDDRKFYLAFALGGGRRKL